MAEPAQPDVNFPDKIVDHIDPSPLRGAVYIFLKKLQGFVVLSQIKIHFPQYFNDPDVIPAEIPAGQREGPGFIVAVQPD
jgi:hypothetical protein